MSTRNDDKGIPIPSTKSETDQGAVGGEDPDDAASVTSNASRSSSASLRSRVQVMRIMEEHKKAELRVKMAALGAKKELQRQRQELQWREEEMELETEMAIQQAKSEVVDRYAREVDDVFPVPLFTAPPPPAPVAPVMSQPAPISAIPVRNDRYPHHDVLFSQHDHHSVADPSPQPEVLQPGVSSVTDVLTGLSQLLAEQTRRNLLPALEPGVFKGDIEQFSLWMRSFECYIEGRTTSPVERLHFLAQYTGGEARSAIHGLLHLRTDDAYDRAKKLLTDRYGNDFITASTYKRRLREWPTVRSGDGKALRQLADFLGNLLVASEEVVGLKVLGEASEISQLLKKLPRYLVERWKRVVDASIYEPARGQEGGYPQSQSL